MLFRSESRVSTARRHLCEAESEFDAWQEQTRDHEELQNVIGVFEEFRTRIEQGLSNPDAASRQAIVRALVKRVEIDGAEVRVVYRVHPTVPAKSRDESSRESLAEVGKQPDPTAAAEDSPLPKTESSAPWLFPYCSKHQRGGGHDGPNRPRTTKTHCTRAQLTSNQQLPAASAGSFR